MRAFRVNGHGHYPFSVECALGNLSSCALPSFWSTGETKSFDQLCRSLCSHTEHRVLYV